MGAKAKTTQARGPTDSFASEAETTPERPDIYPKLEFGNDRLAEGSYVVEFIGNPHDITWPEDKTKEPDPATGERPPGEGWAVAVHVSKCDGDFDDVDKNLPADDIRRRRSIILRKPDMKAGKKQYHSLTHGVLSLMRKHGTLVGVMANITTRRYEHKSYGETRSYDVHSLGRATEAKTSAEQETTELPS